MDGGKIGRTVGRTMVGHTTRQWCDRQKNRQGGTNRQIVGQRDRGYETKWQCPHKERQYRIKNKAAIDSQCKLNVKLIAALFFIPYSSLI